MFSLKNINDFEDKYCFPRVRRNLKPVNVVEFDVCEHEPFIGCMDVSCKICKLEDSKFDKRTCMVIVKDPLNGFINSVPESNIVFIGGNVFLNENEEMQ